MKLDATKLDVNGITYVPEGTIQETASLLDGMEYCIIRTYSAGVFAGYIDRSIGGKERTIYKSRRIWSWEGAASLSQLAVDGTSKPDQCKFPCEEAEKDLLEVIEILPCTKKAEESIKSVKVWSE